MITNQSELNEIRLMLQKILGFYRSHFLLGTVSFLIIAAGVFFVISKDAKTKEFGYLLQSDVISPYAVRYKVDALLLNPPEVIREKLSLTGQQAIPKMLCKIISDNMIEVWVSTSENVDPDQLYESLRDKVILTDAHHQIKKEKTEALTNEITLIDSSIAKLQRLEESSQSITSTMDLIAKRNSLESELKSFSLIQKMNKVEDSIIVKTKIPFSLGLALSLFIAFLGASLTILIVGLFRGA